MRRTGALAVGFAIILGLAGPVWAGAIVGEQNGVDAGRSCIDLRQQPETAKRIGSFVLPSDMSSLDVAPAVPTRTSADESHAAAYDCVSHGEALLGDLAEAALFDSAGSATERLPGSVAEWTVSEQTPAIGNDAASPDRGEGLFATLSHYVTEVPRDTAAEQAGISEDAAASDAIDLDLFGVDGRHVDGLLDQSIWRELLISVLEPAIGSDDYETFSFLGIGQFRLEFDRATSALQLIDAQSRTAVALTPSDGDHAGLADVDISSGGRTPMSTEELVAYMAGRLFSSIWLYVCILGALAGIVIVKLRRVAG